MRQRGYLTIGLAIALAVALLGLAGAAKWAKHEAGKRAEVEGRFTAFKKGVEDAGKKAEQDKLAEAARLKRENEDATKRWNTRVAAANARADGLCKRAGLSSGCRDLPALPDTARPPDDAAHNQRLVELLRHAQTVTDQLIELQEWQRRTVKP